MTDPRDIPDPERGPADDQSDGGDTRWTDDQRRRQGGQATNESPTPDSMAPAEEFIAPRPGDVPPAARPVRQPVPEGDEAADPDDTEAERL
ncbi:MAG: hypothetical protein AB7G21_12765 [Dehalococcoidia bacterium]